MKETIYDSGKKLYYVFDDEELIEPKIGGFYINKIYTYSGYGFGDKNDPKNYHHTIIKYIEKQDFDIDLMLSLRSKYGYTICCMPVACYRIIDTNNTYFFRRKEKLKRILK